MTTDIELNMVNKQEFANLHFSFLPLDGTKRYTLVLYFNLNQFSDPSPRISLHLLVQRAGWQLIGLLHLAITGSLGFGDVAVLLQHGRRRRRNDPQAVPHPRLQRVVPVVVGHRNHPRGKLVRRYFRVPSGEGRHDPDVSESGQAQRAGLLQDVHGLVLGAVEQDHRGLDLLEHDLGPAVLLHCVQDDDVLQVPTHKTEARIEERRGVKMLIFN